MLEERVVVKVLELYTLTTAFEYLKERLDPEKTYSRQLRGSGLCYVHRGNSLQTFIRYLNEALQAELTTKQACVFLVAYVNPEVQAKPKESIRAQDAGISEETL